MPCLSLSENSANFDQLLKSPITEAISNKKGISYVISRMDWYWSLTDSLLDSKEIEGPNNELRDAFEKSLKPLYKKLLLYQIKSICSYHRRRGVAFLRDMVTLDDWVGSIKEVKEAEATIQGDISAFSTEKLEARLASIAHSAKSLEENFLPGIRQAFWEQKEIDEYNREREKDKQCLVDLGATDPESDKARIQETKGGLMKEASEWILCHEDYQQWRTTSAARLFWIKGNPGKGKTMMMSMLVEEMKKLEDDGTAVAYFFVQATNSALNNGTAILKAIIHHLCSIRPHLISYLRKKYDTVGSSVFHNHSGFYTLKSILEEILEDTQSGKNYILIDGLDECEEDLEPLLKLVSGCVSKHDKTKWLLASRNDIDVIERILSEKEDVSRLSLDLGSNAANVSTSVKSYVHHKLSELHCLKSHEALRTEFCETLIEKSEGTFLWVSLVMEELRKVSRFQIKKVLSEMPKGLVGLYDRMLERIYPEYCPQILVAVTIAYKPLSISALYELSGLSSTELSISDVKDIVGKCGCFISIQNDQVYIVHQSAQEYLQGPRGRSLILPSGIANGHRRLFRASLHILSQGALHHDMSVPNPRVKYKCLDSAVSYPCNYWIRHFIEAQKEPNFDVVTTDSDSHIVRNFLTKHFLHWLDAISLIDIVTSCKKDFDGLAKVLEVRPTYLLEFASFTSVAVSADFGAYN